MYLNSHPWPHFVGDNSGLAPRTFAEALQRINEPFEDTYSPLIEGLQNLPKLNRICYAGSADRSAVGGSDGLCAVSDNSTSLHAERHSQWKKMVGTPGFPKQEWAKYVIRWSDIEVIVGILASLGPKFSTVNFTQPALCLEAIRWPLMLRATNRGWLWPKIPAAQGIKELIFTLPGQRGWTALGEQLLKESPELDTLAIHLRSCQIDKVWRVIANPGQEAEGLSDDLPPSFLVDPYLCLKTCRARLDCLGDASIGHNKLRNITLVCHTDPPVCLPLDDLKRLLDGHRNSLRTLTFKNVFFENGLESVKSCMRKAVGYLTHEDLQLKSASWTIRRLEIDRRFPGSHLTQEQLRQRYRNCRGNWFSLECFDEIATELGVRSTNEGWDFADNVVLFEEGEREESTTTKS